MAIVAEDIVAVHLSDASVKMQPQPPIFGHVEDVDTTVDVLWEDGKQSSSSPQNALDKILPPTANALTGQRVFVNMAPSANFQPSSDYQGLVLNLYQRDQGGGGSPTADLALVKLLTSGMYVEVPAANCAVSRSGA